MVKVFNISFVLSDFSYKRKRNLLEYNILDVIDRESLLLFYTIFADKLTLISDSTVRNIPNNTVTYSVSFSSSIPNIERAVIQNLGYSFRQYKYKVELN